MAWLCFDGVGGAGEDGDGLVDIFFFDQEIVGVVG